MKRIRLIIVIAICSCSAKKENIARQAKDQNLANQKKTVPYIERLDDDLDKIIAPNTQPEIIGEGFEWTEGPLWIEGTGLLFSDIPPNKIYKWTEETGIELYLHPAGYTGSISRGGEPGSNGLLLDHAGNLIICQHGDRRLAKMNAAIDSPKPDFITITDNYHGKKLNSPNDACLSKEGVLYFTDPPYGLEELMDDPKKELDFQGIYSYTETEGITLLYDKMSRPNGIALSPDEKTLYVANSDPDSAVWVKFNILNDGTIDAGEIFYNAASTVVKETGLPDGLKVDTKGNIFASGPGGLWIFDASGKVLGKIRTGQATSNCAIGNRGHVLYITADMYLLKVNLR